MPGLVVPSHTHAISAPSRVRKITNWAADNFAADRAAVDAWLQIDPELPFTVAPFFDGTDLVAPGLVRVEEWRQDPGTVSTERSTLWGGVGRKR
jgi:hypothetical protein